MVNGKSFGFPTVCTSYCVSVPLWRPIWRVVVEVAATRLVAMLSDSSCRTSDQFCISCMKCQWFTPTIRHTLPPSVASQTPPSHCVRLETRRNANRCTLIRWKSPPVRDVRLTGPVVCGCLFNYASSFRSILLHTSELERVTLLHTLFDIGGCGFLFLAVGRPQVGVQFIVLRLKSHNCCALWRANCVAGSFGTIVDRITDPNNSTCPFSLQALSWQTSVVMAAPGRWCSRTANG